METCEMCGKQSQLSSTKIAGSTMMVCSSCKSHGIVENQSPKSKVFHHKKKELSTEYVVDDFSSIISKALAQKQLNSHQLARAINLKESSLHKFITGKLVPDIETAKRIQRFLEINLVEEFNSKTQVDDFLVNDEEQSEGLSLGDLIKNNLKNKK